MENQILFLSIKTDLISGVRPHSSILARISKVLAFNEIGIFAISTYNTDYILTKEENFGKAMDVLKSSGYEIRG